jgi:hypothetical protein
MFEEIWVFSFSFDFLGIWVELISTVRSRALLLIKRVTAVWITWLAVFSFLTMELVSAVLVSWLAIFSWLEGICDFTDWLILKIDLNLNL